MLRSLLWLIGLAVCLRALVPAGYMPGQPGPGELRFALSVCTAGMSTSPALAAWLADAAGGASTTTGVAAGEDRTGLAGDNSDRGGHDDPRATAPDCPYGLAAHLALWRPDADALALPAAWPRDARADPAPAAAIAMAGILAGPPLGARAPPFLS